MFSTIFGYILLTKPKTKLKDHQLIKVLFIVYYNLDIQIHYFDESFIKFQILVESFPSKKDLNITPGVIELNENKKPKKDINHHQIERNIGWEVPKTVTESNQE